MRIRAVVGAVVVLAMWALVGAVPISGALAPASTAVYVSNADGDSVSVIDPATNTVVATVPVGDEPRNLAGSPDRSTVYVPNRDDDNVSIIDTDTNTVTKTVNDASFDEPYAVAFTPDGGEVWAVNKKGGGSSTGSVTIISTGSETATGTIDDDCFSSPEGIAMNPVTSRAYVVNRGDDSVCVVDTSTKTVVTSVTTGDNPRFAVVLPDGSAVYVTNNGSDGGDTPDGNVTRIDTSDNSSTTINTGGNPRNAAMTSDGSTVYVPLQDARIAVIPTATDLPTYISFTGANQTYGATVVPGTTLGYVTDEENDEVFVFDTTTNTEVTGTGFPIADEDFDYPRAIASLGEEVVPPPTTTTTTTTTVVPDATTTTAAAQPQALAPTFTG